MGAGTVVTLEICGLACVGRVIYLSTLCIRRLSSAGNRAVAKLLTLKTPSICNARTNRTVEVALQMHATEVETPKRKLQGPGHSMKQSFKNSRRG